jgi:hypothetical protein
VSSSSSSAAWPGQSCPNWSKYGQVQDAFYGDPKAQALLQEAGKFATWQTYVAQTLEL